MGHVSGGLSCTTLSRITQGLNKDELVARRPSRATSMWHEPCHGSERPSCNLVLVARHEWPVPSHPGMSDFSPTQAMFGKNKLTYFLSLFQNLCFDGQKVAYKLVYWSVTWSNISISYIVFFVIFFQLYPELILIVIYY